MKILIADDHGLFRDSIAVWLKQYKDNIQIDFSRDLQGVINWMESDGHHDLIMLDLHMPGMEGAYSVNILCEQLGEIPLIVVSADEDPRIIEACIQAGARGYVPKSSEGETILHAVDQVLSGSRYIPQNTFKHQTSLPVFSKKQLQLMALLSKGLSNREIADRMCLSEGTVKQYVSTILRMLEADNRTQASMKIRKLLGID